MFEISNYYKSPLYVEAIFQNYSSSVAVEAVRCVEFPIHIHGCIELLYVLEGTVDVKVSFHKRTLKAGEFVLINAFDVHGIKSDDPDAKVYMIHFAENAMLYEEMIFAVIDERTPKDKILYNEVAALLCSIGEKYGKASEEELDGLVRKTVKILKARYGQEHYNTSGELSSIDDKAELLSRMRDIYKYMYMRFNEKITLDILSKEFAISKTYLSHYIKAATGTSFQNYINTVRCDRAEIALLEGEKSINDIGEDYGFSSTQYFNSVFSEKFGMTPAEYKKAYYKETIAYKSSTCEPLVSEDTNNPAKKEMKIMFDNYDYQITVIDTTSGTETIKKGRISEFEHLYVDSNKEKIIVLFEKIRR